MQSVAKHDDVLQAKTAIQADLKNREEIAKQRLNRNDGDEDGLDLDGVGDDHEITYRTERGGHLRSMLGDSDSDHVAKKARPKGKPKAKSKIAPAALTASTRGSKRSGAASASSVRGGGSVSAMGSKAGGPSALSLSVDYIALLSNQEDGRVFRGKKKDLEGRGQYYLTELAYRPCYRPGL